jgi:hypothetical protein
MRGPVRGPSHRCKQYNQGHRRHGSVVSVQVVRTMHEAVLLIIRRSWVRSPAAPPVLIRYIWCCLDVAWTVCTATLNTLSGHIEQLPSGSWRKPVGCRSVQPSRFPVGSFSAGMLDARTRARLSGMVTGNAPSAQTTLISIVPILWAGMLRGQPANICLHGCRIFQW